MSYIIGRPINGIPLNGLEYLMNDKRTSEREFGTIKLAKGFLLDNGYDGWTDDDLEDCFMFVNTEDFISKKEEKVLRKAYNQAVEDGQTEFTFKEKVLLVSYTKELLEYFDSLK